MTACEVLNPAKPLPFMINKDEDTDENVRLKYRYLDLRRERMQRNLTPASQSDQIHARLSGREGLYRGRDADAVQDHARGRAGLPGALACPPRLFLCPAPVTPAAQAAPAWWRAYERYFQIARCFRDEDLRGDRQPEFTQLDLEMSFVHRDDVLAMVEGLFTAMLPAVAPHKRLLSSPWPRLTYAEAVNRYGTDKPDLRFGMELVDASATSSPTAAFMVFQNTLKSGRSDQVSVRAWLRGIHAQGSR